MKSPPDQFRLNPEQILLTAAAHPALTAAQVEHLRRSIQPEIDWGLVLDLVAWHGQMPLLAKHLKENCADLVPAAFLAELAARFAANARQSVFATAELLRTLNRLHAAGIDAIPFKGPALAAQLYGDVGLREFFDLDILLTPETAIEADRTLTGAGFVAAVDIGTEQQDLYMRSECDRVYLHPETGIHLELHWAITPPYFGFALPAAELIGRAQTFELCGTAVKSLSPEDLLLVLCVNGAKEMWEKLEWTVAVAALLNREGLDWARIAALTGRTASRRMLLIGLGLAADLLDAEIPVELRREIDRDRRTRKLIAEATAWLFARHFHGLRPWQITRFRLRARERWRDRWRYLFLRLLTPSHHDLALVRLPRRFYAIYYLLRPLRFGWTVLRRKG